MRSIFLYRHGLNLGVFAALLVLFALTWWAATCTANQQPLFAERIQQMEDSMVILRYEAKNAHERARVEIARSDSLAVLASASAETAYVTITRWRERVVPAPFDTAAWLRDGPGLVAAADSMAEACSEALRGCEEAIEGKDRALASLDSARAAQEDRAIRLQGYAVELGERIRTMERRQKWRDLLVGGIGASVGYSVCSLGG